MGASPSTDQHREVDWISYYEHVYKYENMVKELVSVKDQVRVLQKTLIDRETQLETFEKNKEKELEKGILEWNAMEYSNPNEIQLWQVKYQSSLMDKEKLRKDLDKMKNEICNLKRQNSNLQEHNCRLNNELEQVQKKNCKLKERNEEDKKLYEQDTVEWERLVRDMRQKIYNVELANKELQTSNINVRNELENVKNDRSRLKEEIHRREQAISRYKNTVVKLEDDLRQYHHNLDALKEKLTKETVTDKTLHEINQIYRRIEELKQVISIKRDVLVKTIKENDYDEQKKIINELKCDYDICESELASKNIIITNANFVNTYTQYEYLSECNDSRKEALLKQVYQIEISVEDFQNQYHSLSRNLGKDVEEMEKLEKDLNVDSFVQNITAQEELYREVRKICEDEITFRKRILQIQKEDNTSKNTRQVKHPNTLNNGKLNKAPQTPEEKCKYADYLDSHVVSASPKSTSIVLFGIGAANQSEDEDRLIISQFLEESRIDCKSFTSKRLKKGRRSKRPLVVEFTNEEIVAKIMELSTQRNWFLGSSPHVRVYVDK